MTLDDLVRQQHPFTIGFTAIVFMEGQRRAIWNGHVLFVSPAMASLLKDPESIEAVAAALEVVTIPWLDLLSDPWSDPSS